MKTGIEQMAEERAAHFTREGFTAEHDDRHDRSEIICAAQSYIMKAHGTIMGIKFPACFIPKFWPWERQWWKPSADPVRNLVKAGALIAAEIDRLQRAAARPPGGLRENTDNDRE